MKSILGHKITQLITGIFLLLGVYIIMYPPEIAFFRKTSEFAVQVMFGMLFLSFIFLVFNQTRLMFISMLGCGLLAFYLKTASNTDMILPAQNNLPKIKVAHFNLSSFEKYDETFKELIENSDFDVISFQEYTPDWDLYIAQRLMPEYKHAHRMVRADLFGMGIYSRKPIKNIETFYYKEIPNVNITVNTGIQDVHIISSYIAPVSIQSRELTTEDHLTNLADYIGELKNATVILGDFNQVYWTSDITEFRDKTQLNNSRRDVSIREQKPYDHIFYSSLLECVKFWELDDRKQNHVGISATFQTKTSVSNPAILRTIGQTEKQ